MVGNMQLQLQSHWYSSSRLSLQLPHLLTSIDTLDMSIAFNKTSSRSLSGVAIRNSGSQVFSLIEQSIYQLSFSIYYYKQYTTTLADSMFHIYNQQRMTQIVEQNIPRDLVFNECARMQAHWMNPKRLQGFAYRSHLPKQHQENQ